MDLDLVSTLAARLQEARQAYYSGGTPIMSDAAYDALEAGLRQADPSHPLLAAVGAPENTTGTKVRHTVPMGSQNKAVNETELASWHANVGGVKGPNALIVSDKADGISCFEGDTLIHLANGETIPIQEIFEKGLRPQVLTWDAQGGVTTRQVTDSFDNGYRDNWLRLTLEDGSKIVVTADHKFYVPGEGWVEASRLLGKDLQSSLDPVA